MENRKFVGLFLFAIAIALIALPAVAYGPNTTHRALADEMVSLFNEYYPEYEFLDAEKQIIMQGSADEDSLGRQAYHFYDPVYKRGVKFGVRWASSKRWAQDHKLQAKRDPRALVAGALMRPFSASSDYSWERSIYEYTWGDKARGLKGLGQVLHLVQDAAVPAHTRDDPHPPFSDMGSPYENFAKRFMPENTTIVERLLPTEVPLVYETLDEHFSVLANYSNKNFFSKDTIFEDRYYYPQIDFERIEKSGNESIIFGYRSEESEIFRIVGRLSKFDWQQELDNSPTYFIKDPDNLILTDTWNLLSKRAVLHGAGVIRLFFYEVEKERQSERLLAYNQSPADRWVSTIASLFSPTKRLQHERVLTENLEFKDDWVQIPELTQPEPRRSVRPQPVVQVQPEPVVVIKDLPADNSAEDPPEEVAQTADIQKEEPPAPIVRYYGGGGGVGGGSPIPEESQPATLPQTPAIISPTDGTTLTDTSIIFTGTSTPGAVVTNDFNTATTTVEDTNNWTLSLDSLPQGTTTIAFTAINSAGSSDIATSSIFIDSLGPALSIFSVAECSNSLAQDGCLLATSTLSLLWNEAPDSSSGYAITCDTCGSATFPHSTTSTSTSVTIEKEGVHTLVLQAEDALGNTSTLSSQQIEVNTQPVVINEIAWMGTATSTSDEWIELYNTSQFSILLGTTTATSTWELTADDGTPHIELEGSIAAQDYFILERTASTTLSYSEDQTYTGALVNSGENLTLTMPDGAHSDRVEGNDPLDASAWIAGNNELDLTMERINPLGEGIIYNWRTATTTATTTTVFDANGDLVGGTPGEQNSIYNGAWRPTFIADDTVIRQNTTWDKNGSPYIVESNASEFLTIASGATLTIEEGVVLMGLSDIYEMMSVEGTIRSLGTANEEVVFTFYDDADYGGETIGNKGEWKGIEIKGTVINSLFDHTRFRYGGSDTKDALLDIESGADITIRDSLFEHNKGWVVRARGDDFGGNVNFADVVIEDSTFIENGIPGLAGDAAIYTRTDSNPITGQGPHINDNTFTDNEYAPVKIVASYPVIGANTANGNFTDAIPVITISGDFNFVATDVTWSSSLPYILETDIIVASTTTFTLEPGVVVKASGGASNDVITVEGALNWNATALSPGTITSLHDDTYGGDTNVYGTSTTPSIGDWGNIHFSASSTGSFANVNMLYGSDGASTTTPGVVVESGASVIFNNVNFGP